MWNTDGPPRENKQLYGEHPIWMTLGDNFSTGGIMWASVLQFSAHSTLSVYVQTDTICFGSKQGIERQRKICYLIARW